MLRRSFRLKPILPTRTKPVLPTRTFSVALRALKGTETPKNPKKGNFLLNAFNYVRKVDERMEKLENETPQRKMISELMPHIDTCPELLAVLLLFHYELALLGITRTSPREFTPAEIRAYRWAYIFKLQKIHQVFWDQCGFIEIAQHAHTIGFLPSNIGALDPANFSKEQYEMLQRGLYNGVDFRNVMIIGSNWSSRKPVLEEPCK